MAEFHARYPSAYQSVGKARRAITAFAQQWFDPQALSDIESAVGEALANSAEHGSPNGTTIEIDCRYERDVLTIEIKDSGSGFDRWDSAECARPVASAGRGFGTYIMRRCMDEIEYSDRGTRIRLVKKGAAPRAFAGDSGERSS